MGVKLSKGQIDIFVSHPFKCRLVWRIKYTNGVDIRRVFRGICFVEFKTGQTLFSGFKINFECGKTINFSMSHF